MDISRTHTTLRRLNTSTIRSLPSNEWLISQSQEVLRSTWPNNSSQFGSRTSLTNRSIDERPRYTGRYKYATVFQYFVQCTTQPAHPIQSSQHYSSPPTPNQPTNQTKPNQTKPSICSSQPSPSQLLPPSPQPPLSSAPRSTSAHPSTPLSAVSWTSTAWPT